MGFKDIDTIWTFVLNNETWKVDNIEQIEVLFDYIKMENIIPLHNPINTSA